VLAREQPERAHLFVIAFTSATCVLVNASPP
jgi:hypothetical protein